MESMPVIDGYQTLKVLVNSGVLGVRIFLANDGPKNVIIKYYKPGKSKRENRTIKHLLENEKRALHYLKQMGTTAAVDILSAQEEVKSHIVLEYLSRGTLYDFIVRLTQSAIPHSEDLTRTVFRMLLSNVYAIHEYDVVHLDLKPENIMFDGYNRMKLIDFGHYHSTKEDVKIPHANVGTKQYQAPEILYNAATKESFVGKPADIYSLGIILFVLHFRNVPFSKADNTDEGYKLIIEEDYDVFKDRIRKITGAIGIAPVSDSLIELIIGMLAYTPETRLTLGEISGHPWMTDVTPEQNEVAENQLQHLLNNFYS